MIHLNQQLTKLIKIIFFYILKTISPIFLKYTEIKNKFRPAFWLSSKFPKGLENLNSSISDLSGNGFTSRGTTLYSTDDGFLFDKSNNFVSNASFSSQYTFFVKGRLLTNVMDRKDFLLVVLEIKQLVGGVGL